MSLKNFVPLGLCPLWVCPSILKDSLMCAHFKFGGLRNFAPIACSEGVENYDKSPFDHAVGARHAVPFQINSWFHDQVYQHLRSINSRNC